MKNRILFAASIVIALVAQAAVAQAQTVTAQDYARAEKMLSYNTAPLVDRSGVRPTFLPDGKFWYQVLTPTGREYVLVNPADGSRAVDTDLPKLIPRNPHPPAQSRNPNESISHYGIKAVFSGH